MLNLVDNPGFAVGIEHEIAGTIRKGGEWMVAFAQVAVPIFTVLMRRSFGVAGNNYATPRSAASVRVAWPAADVGGIPPEGGIEAAYKRQLAEAADPAALRAEINARIESVRGPIGPLNRFEIEEMIDPRDTRRLVCEWVADAYRIVAPALAAGAARAAVQAVGRLGCRPQPWQFPHFPQFPLPNLGGLSGILSHRYGSRGRELPARLGGFRGFPGRNSSEGVSALSATATAPATASLKFRRDRHLREFAQFPLPIRQSPENTFAPLLGPEKGCHPFRRFRHLFGGSGGAAGSPRASNRWRRLIALRLMTSRCC